LVNETKIFKKLKKEEAEEILKVVKFPLGTVRFLPKPMTIRPIINLGKKVLNNPNSKYEESTNSILKKSLYVMKLEMNKDEEMIGSSV
jgi:hypothetical protein